MIIEIILINFFKKYYMNKKLKNTLINNYPLISIIILCLIYLYLNAPDNILEQKGGEPEFDYPPNTPLIYKYRFAFVAFPFLLIGLIMYYAYFTHVVSPSYNMWSLGLDFFSNFQTQYNIAVADPNNISPADINYRYTITPSMTPDMKKFFNMIQLTGDPLGGMYIKAQYFCNSARPCNCCLNNSYTKYFFDCSIVDGSCLTNASYKRICQPNGK